MITMIAMLLLSTLLTITESYKPIIALHGLSLNNKQGSYHDYDHIKQWVKESHPGQLFIALDAFTGLESTINMWTQRDGIAAMISAIIASNPVAFANGYHFIGHSQGGLMMRVMLETLEHDVDTFVSMAGVQMGVYGLRYVSQYFKGTLEYVTDVLYTDVAQRDFSVANYWHYPVDKVRYVTKCSFLPVVNNQTSNPNWEKYKKNFLRVRNVHLFGSPDDGTVYPWQSEIFGFYDTNVVDIVDIYHQSVYLQDSFGLKTLDERGGLHIHVVDGVEHGTWLTNKTNFLNNIMPLLI